jgi:hypothetical protein
MTIRKRRNNDDSSFTSLEKMVIPAQEFALFVHLL